MDAFKQQLQRIQDQLSGLNGTQRMLVFSLVTVMVLTLLLWSRYAATPDMVPLLSTAVGPQDSVRIHSALTARGIRFRDSGATIMVSPDDLNRAVAAVASENAFPSDSDRGLNNILDRMTPWDSQSKSSEYWRLHTAERIRETVRLMDGVVRASVNISAASQQRIGGGSVVPTAVVYVATRTPMEKASRNMVEGIAAIVSGSMGGIKRSDIHVVVDGKPYPLSDASARGSSGGEIIERQTEWEERYAEKVRRALYYIPGVAVSVSARLNNESKETRVQAVDEVVSKEKEINSETNETTQANASTLSDPGVAANTGGTLALGSGGATGNSTSSDKSITKMELFPTRRDELTINHGGDAIATAAAISIPRGYYVAQMKGGNPSAGEPDPSALEVRVAQENAVIQEQVRALLGLADASAVSVRMFVEHVPDWGGTGGGGSGAGSGGDGMIASMVRRYGKELAIGLLATASLLMVLMIVRRSAPAPLVIPSEITQRSPSDIVEIDGNEPLVGIASLGNPTLDAIELGDDDLKSQQVVDQVNNMVKENPDAAASLLKRWLNRS